MRATSSTRLGIALVVQLAITIADVSITGSGVIVSSAALLVPFALAVIGTERETAITAVVAFAIGIGSLFWNDTPSTGQTIYRILFYALVALLTVVAARARERATDLADNNQALARDLDATQARLDGILGSLGEAVTVHDERGKTIYANEAAAKLLGCESVEEVLASEPGELAAHFTITKTTAPPVAVDDLPGRRLLAGRERADAAHAQRPARHRRVVLAAHQGDPHRGPVRRQAGDQHHRGRHRRQGRGAAPALPRRGRPAARLVARLRGRRSSASRA